MERGRGAENFLKFYFDTELLTEDEAKQQIAESGRNIEEIEKKREEFLRRIEAKEKLAEAEETKKKFEQLVEEFDINTQNEVSDTELENYRTAARKGEAGNEKDIKSDIRDIKMLKKIEESKEDGTRITRI